jgi:hypothetical protein
MPVKRSKPPSLLYRSCNVACQPGGRRCHSPRTPGAVRLFYSAAKPPFRSTNDVVDQLQAELHAEREQHAFVVGELEKQVAMLLRDLMQAKYEIAQRNLVETFSKMESPSTRLH